MNLEGKTVIVTGSAKGLGRALIEEFAKNKCNVVITYNNSYDKAIKLEKKIKEEYGVNTQCIKCDVTNEEDIKNMINSTVDNFGKIDILINNAAYAMDNYINDKTKDEFMKVLETNLVGPFLTIKHAYTYMDNGIIVNISSKDAVSTYSDINIDYSASKAGLNNLTKSMSLALNNTKVVAVMPGWINTESIKEMNPEYLESELKRVGQEKLSEPDCIAKQIIDIIKDKSIKTGSLIDLED